MSEGNDDRFKAADEEYGKKYHDLDCGLPANYYDEETKDTCQVQLGMPNSLPNVKANATAVEKRIIIRNFLQNEVFPIFFARGKITEKSFTFADKMRKAAVGHLNYGGGDTSFSDFLICKCLAEAQAIRIQLRAGASATQLMIRGISIIFSMYFLPFDFDIWIADHEEEEATIADLYKTLATFFKELFERYSDAQIGILGISRNMMKKWLNKNCEEAREALDGVGDPCELSLREWGGNTFVIEPMAVIDGAPSGEVDSDVAAPKAAKKAAAPKKAPAKKATTAPKKAPAKKATTAPKKAPAKKVAAKKAPTAPKKAPSAKKAKAVPPKAPKAKAAKKAMAAKKPAPKKVAAKKAAAPAPKKAPVKKPAAKKAPAKKPAGKKAAPKKSKE